MSLQRYYAFFIVAWLALVWTATDAQRIIATADTEGHIGACGHCPGQAGMGGMAPRGDALKQLRDAKEPLLVLDAGNALIGTDSVATQGAGIVASLNELNYDVMNVACSDFFYGKETTVKTLSAAKFAVVSANLLDEKTGQLMFKPYVVIDRDGQKTAIIGVTEPPAGLDMLPNVKQQLAGVKIDPPVTALTQYIPKAKAESSQIVVLYYGTSRGLRQIRQQFGSQLAAIVVGGMRPDQAPPGVIASQTHGTTLASFKLPGGPLEQINLQQTATADAAPAMPAVKETKRVPAHSDLKPKGLEGVGLTAEQVNASIDRGAAFLWNYIKTEDLGKHHDKLGDPKEHLLALLALVHAGAIQKFPDFEPALRAYLAQPKGDYSIGTYEDGLLCMLIESYGDPEFFREQRAAAQYLVDCQGPGGTWTYVVGVPPVPASGTPSGEVLSVRSAGAAAGARRPGISRLHDWTVGRDGDNSCSQFAILGLHSASRCNNPIADEVWSRNLDANTRRQNAPDGSWSYNDTASAGYGSMTCAGICAVAVARYELHQNPPEVDPRIERGLAWLDANFSVTENPQYSNYLFYYLYSLERVGRVLDTEFIGTHEWYPLGARVLVDSQKPDGKWIESVTAEDPRVPTSFALLFLTRATPKLQIVEKHGGPGILRAQVQSPPPSRIYIILDASGSMIDVMQGQNKFDIARNAVKSLVDALPDSTEVALRVYGNYKTALDPDCDSDTTLEIRMGPLDRKAFAAKLKSLRARGKTPLALSLTDAVNELSTSQSEPATLLLLTDGGEDTMPRRNPVKAADELAKRTGLTFHIIGFDINQADWGEQLRAMAEHGHGYYWAAAGAEDLPAQLGAAVFGKPTGFSVLDAQGKLVTQGRFGQPVTLPEGSYRMSTAYAGRTFDAPFAVNTDRTTAILFDAAQIATSAQPTPAAPPLVPAEPVKPTSPTAKFCTHCGSPLPPGAKFCPKCGEPVPH